MRKPAPDNPATATPASPPPHRAPSAAWAERAFVAAACLAIAFIWYHYLSNYWGRWGSITVDFGRELYIPWQITQGKALYRDVAHINGPLSPYCNALLFSVFGVSLNTIEIANLGISVLAAALIWRIVSFLTNHCVASVTVIVFFLLSVFSHDYDKGIFSFIAPYSHEITHGMLLGLLCLVLVARYAGRPSRTNAFLLGGVAGLGLLTKPEIALAVVASTGAGFVLVTLRPGQRAKESFRRAALLVLGLALPFGLALFWLSLSQPMADAFAGMTRMWRMTLNPAITDNYFYQNVLGIRVLSQSIHNLGRAFLFDSFALLYILVMAQAGRFLPRRRGLLASIFIIVTSLYCIQAAPSSYQISTSLCWTASLPLLIALFNVFLLIKILTSHTILENGKFILLCSLSVFASFTSLKIFLNARPIHYGNFLLIPLLMLSCMAILSFLPNLFKKKPAVRNCAFCCGLIVLYFVIAPRAKMSEMQLSFKNKPITQTGEAIYLDARSAVVQKLLDKLGKTAKSDQTLALLPEGSMINFLLHLPNSTPYINLMPPEWNTFGGDNIIASYKTHQPDFICLIKTAIDSYGIPSFEEDYGALLIEFVKSNYTEIDSDSTDFFYYHLYRHH